MTAHIYERSGFARALGFLFLSLIFFDLMSVQVRALVQTRPAVELSAYRNLFGILPSLGVIDRSTTKSPLGFKDPYELNEWSLIGAGDILLLHTDGLTEHICPAEIPEDIAQYMLDIALDAHRLLGCKGASRTDFRWDDELGKNGVFVLETNTQPGMTPLSLVPEQARHVGISYEQLVDMIVKEALA